MKHITASWLAVLFATIGCHPMWLQPREEINPAERVAAGQVVPEPNSEPVTEDDVTLEDPRSAASRLAAEMSREAKEPVVRPTVERVNMKRR